MQVDKVPERYLIKYYAIYKSIPVLRVIFLVNVERSRGCRVLADTMPLKYFDISKFLQFN